MKEMMKRQLALLLLLLGACAADPAAIDPRVGRVRALDDQTVAVYSQPVTGWPRCLEIMEEWRAVLSVATLTVYHACANLPPATALPPGARAWCIVVAPPWPADVLRHELKHCRGFGDG